MSTPSSWKITNLEDVVVIRDDLRKPVNADERASRVGPYPYYGATGQVGWIDGYLMDGEYILLGEDGAPFLDPSKDKAYRVVGKSWVNNHAHVLHGEDGVLDNRYLLHALNYTDYRQFANGTTRLKLTQGAMRRIPIPVAPFAEQHRIVAKIEELFSDLDAGVAALKRAKANLKRYRAAVLKAAVEGKLTEEWRVEAASRRLSSDPKTRQDAASTYEPASALLARILKERRQKWEADQLAKFAAAGKEPPKNWRDKYVEPSPPDTSALPELPEGWCWATTGLLCDCIVPNRDKPKSFSGDIPWITLPDLDGRIQLVSSGNGMGLTEAEARLHKAKVIPAGSVIMSCIGRFGLSAVLGRDAVINQQLHAFLVPELLSARYIAYAIRTQERLMVSLSTATTIAYLNQDKCNSIPIALAPLDEQKQIVNEVDVRLSQIAAAETEIEQSLLRASRLRQSILKQAFEGKLVPQDPKDEPASVLLDRLRASRSAHEVNGKTATPARTRGRRAKSKQVSLPGEEGER